MDPAALALVVYSTQIVLVVCVAAIGAALGRLSVPAVRLAYWRGVGALCLVLPLLAATRTDTPSVFVGFGAGAIGGVGNDTADLALIAVGGAILWVWACGMTARLGWLALGAYWLRQIRRRSVPAVLGTDLEVQRSRLAPGAQFRWTLDLRQPVTFGVRRPVVLLPPRFADLSPDAQRAVACHELLHVARRDWIWIVLEEHVRALFWFHPGIWWLVEQVQLAREQVIDELVVGHTASRREYMSALMTFADVGWGASLSNTFMRRGHLRSRLRQLSKESHMSLRRLVSTTTALTLVLGATAIGAARALPLDLAALTQVGADSRLSIRLAESAPAAGLVEAVVPGSNQRIYLHPTTLATGSDVTSARVIDMGGHFNVVVTFTDSAAARMTNGTSTYLGRPVAILVDGKIISAPTLRAPIGDSAVISGIFTAEAAAALASALTPGVAALNTDAPGGVVLPVPIRQVRPVYTQAAMSAGIEGSVLLDVVVLSDGSIGDVTVARSLDARLGLDQQAVDALRQWEWKPGTKDGTPEPVAVTVEITFTLK